MIKCLSFLCYPGLYHLQYVFIDLLELAGLHGHHDNHGTVILAPMHETALFGGVFLVWRLMICGWLV